MTTTGGPTVFVIDDDDLVRASIQGMLKSAGLRAETFGTAQSSCAASARMAQVALFWTWDSQELAVWISNGS